MKKLLLCLLCLLVLCGCGKQETETSEMTEEEVNQIINDATEGLVGGWMLNPDLAPINDADFETATKELGYTPLAVLGSQVVSGTNTMYLAYSGSASTDINEAFKVVTIYKGLDDSVELLSAVYMDIETYVSEIDTASNEEAVGAYSVNSELPNLCTDEQNTIFNEALEGFVGVGYTPVCVLASQVVAGTNYCYLALGTTATAEPITNLYIISIYDGVDGSRSINNIYQLDLASFNEI